MRIPDSLASLVDHGILDEVLRPLMSGKEAQVYLVVSNGEERVAKVYKESQNRTFKNRAEYTEGRRVRSSRDQRAMEKRSRYGRAQDEAAWRSAEVDMIYRLAAAGVRVPKPYHFIDGVLIMELVKDDEGNPAPRLGDLVFSPEQAVAVFQQLISETARMLCAGVVHGDLSDFNVLMAADGPVIIDFPQAVNASGNQNARRILVRDVANLQRFLARHMPQPHAMHYAEEMWALYERNALTPDTKLTGRFRGATRAVTTEAVMSLVKDAEYDERKRREGLGLSMRGVPREQRPNDQPHGRRGPQQGRVDTPQGGRLKLELRPNPSASQQRPQAERGPVVQQRSPRAGGEVRHERPQRPQHHPHHPQESNAFGDPPRQDAFGARSEPRERAAHGREQRPGSEKDARRFRQQDAPRDGQQGRAAERGPATRGARPSDERGDPQRPAQASWGRGPLEPGRGREPREQPGQRPAQGQEPAPHAREQPPQAREQAPHGREPARHAQGAHERAGPGQPQGAEGSEKKRRRRRRRGRKPADGASTPETQG